MIKKSARVLAAVLAATILGIIFYFSQKPGFMVVKVETYGRQERASGNKKLPYINVSR